MLHDPKWERQIEGDSLSLASLIAWLEKQPPKRRYRYRKPHSCLAAQWLKSVGAAQYVLHACEVSRLFDGAGDFVVLGPLMGTAADRTFGAALDRARAALAHGVGGIKSLDDRGSRDRIGGSYAKSRN
jgi:hypothetical protein